jgi:hypothetical protein
MMQHKLYQKGARPVRSKELLDFYENTTPAEVTMSEYEDTWREWINYTDMKSIEGLDNFPTAHYTQGTSQAFDNFILRHCKTRQINALLGDFQYHACQGKHVDFAYIDDVNSDRFVGRGLNALIISAPFSDFGCMHPEFERMMRICCTLDIPVCLDLAYWGICKNIHIDLDKYPCIEEVVFSLSKPFFPLETHRVGIRFSRKPTDDGVTMINDVGYQNKTSMNLGVHFMKHFDPDWNWNKHGKEYERVCEAENLVYTDTLLFGLGDEERHYMYSRGVPGNFRVCISDFMSDC